jgi:hypothetical protein
MSRWILAAVFCLGSAGFAAAQQTGNGVNMGLNSDGGAMSGANIDRVTGTNPNGTPRQQMPGASMTNGAGNSTMTPGVTGGFSPPEAPDGLPSGITTPTINGHTTGTVP